jgi:hypothetical protein
MWETTIRAVSKPSRVMAYTSCKRGKGVTSEKIISLKGSGKGPVRRRLHHGKEDTTE